MFPRGSILGFSSPRFIVLPSVKYVHRDMISKSSPREFLREFPMENVMLSNKEAVIEVVESCSEIGVAGLAGRLRLDKGTVRKVALEAAREGRIGARNDGSGYVFFPAAPRQMPWIIISYKGGDRSRKLSKTFLIGT
jgi:hypothetical protein